MPIDAQLPSSSSDGLVSAVVDGYHAHDGQWALLVLDSYDEADMDAQMQRVADRLWTTVYWQIFELSQQRTALLVYDGFLLA